VNGHFSADILRAVRRWLTIFLLLLLPLQFSWAAAASYCGHETSASAAQHFGHHAHAHQQGDAPADDAASNDDGAPAADRDCDYCNLFGAKPLIPKLLSFAAPSGGCSAEATPAAYESHIPDGLERPDRRVA
jgi:hypothetical protein